VADAEPLPLDHVLAGGGGVQQEVHKVVLQQVHLVDVEETAVRAGEQPRLERLDALGQRPLQVERADNAVLGGAQREIDDGDRRALALQRSVLPARPALSAERAR
jgi:hypothetical protein